MVIDFHLHIPDSWIREDVPPRTAAERLIEFMDSSGIDVGVTLLIAPYISNDYVYRIVSYEPRKLIGFTSVMPKPADIAVKELRRAIK